MHATCADNNVGDLTGLKEKNHIKHSIDTKIIMY